MIFSLDFYFSIAIRIICDYLKNPFTKDRSALKMPMLPFTDFSFDW